MRQLTMMSALIALLLAVSNTAWAEQTVQLRVDGLACPFCAYGIEKKLRNTEGVKDLEIRINEGVVRVTLADNARFDEARARRIVTEAGFTLRGFETLAGAE